MSIMDFLNSDETKKFEKALEKIVTFMNDDDIKTFLIEYEKFMAQSAQKEIKKTERPKKTSEKHLVEYFPGYTKEQIINAFQNLIPRYQEILIRAYGDNLDKSLCSGNFTKEEKVLLNNARSSLKGKLRNPNPQTKTKKLTELIPDYTMEDIKAAFERLNPKHQEILTRAYGDNLDKPLCRANFTEEEKVLLASARKSLKVKLTNSNSRTKNKKLTELISGYTMGDIKVAFEKLNPKHQEILTRAYGDNLDKPVCTENFTKKEIVLLGSAQKSLKGKLRNPNSQTTNKKLTELIPDYTMEDIKAAFERLNPKHQEILTKAYGENLDKPVCRANFTEEEKKLLDSAQTGLKGRLSNPNLQTKNKKLTVLIPDYTMEDIKTAFEKLNPKYQEILTRAYGDNLDKPLCTEKFTKEEKKLLNNARDRLKGKLRNPNPQLRRKSRKKKYMVGTNFEKTTGNPAVKLSKTNKNLYEIFSEYTKEEVDKAMKFLPKEARNIILIFFGGNYNEPGNYSYLPEDSYKYLGCALEKLNESLKKLIKERTSNLPTNVVKTDVGLYRVDKFNLISFFTKYGCTKVQIVYFYLNLDKKEKDLIIKVCGQTLEDSDGFVLFDHNELQTFKNTIKKLKQLLFDNLKSKKPIEKKVRLTSIYERFSEYPKETVDFVISQVDSKVIERFKKFFYNENLNNESIVFVSQDDYNFLCNVLAMIEKRLKINSKNARNVSRKKNVSMIINEKDRKKIVVPSKEKMQWFAKMLELPGKEREALINQLDDSDIELLKKAYGPYYTLKLNGELTDAELTRLSRIFIHIKYLYASTHKATKFMASNKTLSESLGVDQLVATDLVYQLLGESEIELLKITYGENLSNKRHNSILTTYEKKLVNKIIGFLRSEIEKQIELKPDGEYKLVHRF